jgi:hypothetical protein
MYSKNTKDKQTGKNLNTEDEHDDRYDQEYDHSYEHWQRRRYGGAVSVPGEYRDRAPDRYDTRERVGARPPQRMPPPEWSDERYMADEYYAYAPEYYRERYMPEEDYLKKLYMLMFRNIEYDIKVPIMQIIATGALFFIFMLNYSINYQYVEHLGNFSSWVALQPPPVAAILGAIFGIFIYLFPSLDIHIFIPQFGSGSKTYNSNWYHSAFNILFCWPRALGWIRHL